MVNYKHLHYFWAVAREGGVGRASERLNLTPQTISAQLSLLEESLGVDLFTRAGRNLQLTETGRLALSYADEIFSLGAELEEAIRQLPKAGLSCSSLAWWMLCPNPSPIESSSRRCRCKSPCE